MQCTNPSTTYTNQQPIPWIMALCLWGYIIFVLYASLYPFDDWLVKPDSPWLHLLNHWQHHIYAFDVIQNLLFYMPIGALMIALMNSTELKLLLPMALFAILICLLISFTLESLQFYKAERVSSGLDVFLNTLSGALGALLMVLFRKPWYAFYQHFQQNIMHPISWKDPMPFCGICGIAIWGAFQLYPFLPTLHLGHLHQGIAPLVHSFSQWPMFDSGILYNYILQGILINLFCALWLRRYIFQAAFLLVTFTLLLKICTIGRVVSLEAIFGALIGLCIGCGLIVLLEWLSHKVKFSSSSKHIQEW